MFLPEPFRSLGWYNPFSPETPNPSLSSTIRKSFPNLNISKQSLTRASFLSLTGCCGRTVDRPPTSFLHLTADTRLPPATSGALLTSLSQTNRTEAEGHDAEDIYRFALSPFQFHVLSPEAPANEVPEEDEESVVPAGTRPHKGPSVLLREWESTTVPMFVTSSYGRILHESSWQQRTRSLPLKYLHLFAWMVFLYRGSAAKMLSNTGILAFDG